MSIDLAPKVKEARVIAVLIPLLLLHITLISLQIEEPGGTTLLKRWVLFASTPFFDVSSKFSRATQNAWLNYVWLRRAREENDRLKSTLRDLSLREKALSEAQQENLRLRRLLGMKEAYSFQGVAAHLVGRAPGFLANVMYVDRGTESGVQTDQPVTTEAGVIGRVLLVSRNHAQIQLITNPDASIGVMIDRSRSPGVLRGTGNPLLELNYIGNTEQVDVGDLVVTSGLDGIFPKGLPVGKVVDTRKGKSVFRLIQVEPLADLIRIEEVLILTNKPPLQ